ncbi:TadE/TadG family type IV pilus assembly protein [Luteococcus sp. OSA5]|uniref:TadE/TadG family type IV pilus assembly protein n=1 Tax=Luteococcus sp. OSA5 TaxID=3401630 RepID=UPI003B429D2E
MTGRWRRRSQGRNQRGRNQRGAAAIEVVVLVPALVLVLGVLVAGWRLWSARTQVVDAAGAAARAATLERSGGAARLRAERVAAANLDAFGLSCEPAAVDVDTSGFLRPSGSTADVRVAISCQVPLDDLVAPGLPGHWRVRAAGTHRLDTFRERTP